jgi:hypothetical protein
MIACKRWYSKLDLLGCDSETKCNCKKEHSTAGQRVYLHFVHRYIGGKEGTRLRRDVGMARVTSHQSCATGIVEQGTWRRGVESSALLG